MTELKTKLYGLEAESAQRGGQTEDFSRKSTFSRAFTFDGETLRRTMTETMRRLDPDEEYTKAVINDYVKAKEEYNDGDMPLPGGFTHTRAFWKTLLAGALMAGILALLALLFMNITDQIPVWWINCDFKEQPECGLYYHGKHYYILVTAGGGLLVGLLRYFSGFPDQPPGLFKEINECHVDYTHAPMAYIISAVSLATGATLGPEQALVTLGGGLGSWVAEKFDFYSVENNKYVVLIGMAAALGALFPNPIFPAMMLHELGKPPKAYLESLILMSFTAIAAFIVYYPLTPYTYLTHITDSANELSIQWNNDGFTTAQIFISFLIGIMSAVLCFTMLLFIGIHRQLFAKMRLRLEKYRFLQVVLPPVFAGVIIGTINWALPLTIGNGKETIGPIINNGSSGFYSEKLLLCVGFSRMVLLGLSQNCGFIGGIVFPMLTIGAVAGTVTNIHYPSIPLGMCISTYMAAIPCGLLPMPMTMIWLLVNIFALGVYQSVPVFISVLVSYLIISGSGFLEALQKRQKQQADGNQSDIEKEIEKERKEADEYALNQYLGNKDKPVGNVSK